MLLVAKTFVDWRIDAKPYWSGATMFWVKTWWLEKLKQVIILPMKEAEDNVR